MTNTFTILSKYTDRRLHFIDNYINNEIQNGNIEFSLFKPTSLENT
jgi:hypothetical protein